MLEIGLQLQAHSKYNHAPGRTATVWQEYCSYSRRRKSAYLDHRPELWLLKVIDSAKGRSLAGSAIFPAVRYDS